MHRNSNEAYFSEHKLHTNRAVIVMLQAESELRPEVRV